MLSHLKSTFSLLQYVDIEENSVPFNDLSFIIAKREIAIQKPTIGSIRPPATKLHLNRFSGAQSRPPVCQHSVGVVRMKRTRPAPSHRLFSGLAGVLQPALAQKISCSIGQAGPHVGGQYVNGGPKLSLAAQDLLFCRLALGD